MTRSSPISCRRRWSGARSRPKQTRSLIPGSINIPHTELESRLDALQNPNGIVIYCIVGRRTRIAEQTLLDHGIYNVFHIEGGFGAWISGQYFIKKGKQS